MEETSPPVKVNKPLRKGTLVRVDKNVFESSMEAQASDLSAPQYIFDGPGEILMVNGDYAQVRWRKPVPDIWLRIDQLKTWQSS